jgi:hypothetical protein
MDERDAVEGVRGLDGGAVVVGVDDRIAPRLGDPRSGVAGLVLPEVVARLVGVAREVARAVVQDVLVVLGDDDGWQGLPLPDWRT